ncbi:NPCBM/NEW2 domain-containing protein [Gemmata sp. JC673]|uniref:NPCBM/NEW2 domain-containing protein n=1 Tax=Gemmata algarum TaxID=2975278 RepID=A0ABU5EX04_9BACT|nr:NPCBM/NEW2 domain-containing protein [Gemmata algarum]MDY3558358.1 NPCBM/NEW2 domain-containing protein [Gemmata algarum]
MRTPTRIPALLLGLVGLATAGTPAGADDLTTAGGKKLTGKLVAVEADNITFAVGDSKAVIPVRDVVVIDLGNKVGPLPKDAGTFSEIELTDGSTFRVAKFALKEKAFTVDQFPAPAGVERPKLEIPVSAVFSAMKKADDQKVRDNWKKMLGTRGKRDLYVIAQETGFTFIQGTVLGGGVDEKGRPVVNFEKEAGGKEDLLLTRSAGLVFHQPQPASVPATLCKVTDVFGHSLTAANIALTPEGVTVITVAGVKVTYPSTAALVRFDYALGNVAYLSDLDPQLEVPELAPEEKGKRLNQPAAYLKDRSFANEAIKLDNQTFPKGVVLAPDTVATFTLNGDYSQFKAMAGIDENGADAAAAARVTIEGDGQVLFSELLKRKDKPKGLVLAVKGVKQLRVIVETDTPLNGNYVTLADARVQK